MFNYTNLVISVISFQQVPCTAFSFVSNIQDGAGFNFLLLLKTRRVGGLLGVAGRLSGTVSPVRAEQGTSLETPSRVQYVYI